MAAAVAAAVVTTVSTPSMWVIGAPFALVGAVLLWIALRAFGRDRAIKSWPRADGVILSSEITASTQQYTDRYGYWRTWEACTPKVRYRYTANANTIESKEFEGSRITRVSVTSDRGRTQLLINRYPVGQAVQVYYDPKDPASSVLQLQTSIAGVIIGGMGMLFLLLGLGISVIPLFV